MKRPSLQLDRHSLSRADLQIRVEPQRLAKGLILVVALLTAAQIGALYLLHFQDANGLPGLLRLVRFGAESNLPTYFSALLLLCCALLFAAAGLQIARPKHGTHLHWLGLAMGFMFLSVDDVSMLHETLADYLDTLLDTPGFLAFSWVIPASIGIALTGIFYLRFLAQLPRKTCTSLLLSCGLFFGGAIGMEMVAGAYGTRHGFLNVTFDLIITAKKLLEMAGLILLLYSLCSYLGRYHSAVRLVLHEESVDPPHESSTSARTESLI